MNKSMILRVNVFVSVLCLSLSLMAAPAVSGYQAHLQPDGSTIMLELRGDEFYHYWADQQGNIMQQDATGFWQIAESAPAPALIRQRRAASPLSGHMVAGKHRTSLPEDALIILVQFPDLSFQSANTRSAMQTMMSGASYTYDGATGSAKSYFQDQSAGHYAPNFKVVGPVTMSHNLAYYGDGEHSGNDRAAEMVLEACKLVDQLVDFKVYKKDAYTVDFVYVIFAGYQENEGAPTSTIWAHNWNVTSAYNKGLCSLNPADAANKVDGLKIGDYACSSELRGKSGTHRSGIGTFCHEFSHVLGLPDLYDADGTTNGDATVFCPGYWSPLGSGNYLNNGRTPCGYSIYDKFYLGWIQPVVINQAGRYTLSTDSIGYQINANGTQKSWNAEKEWVYYLENRQQTGWDKYLPGHGLLIWKVYYQSANWTQNKVNAFSAGVCCSIVPADDSIASRGDAGDAFPGNSATSQWTRLNAYPIYDIVETNGLIRFNLKQHIVPDSCTITFMADGEVYSSRKYEVGDRLILPARVSSCDGRSIVGWTAQPNYLDPFASPADLFTSAPNPTVTSSTTYYAVFL